MSDNTKGKTKPLSETVVQSTKPNRVKLTLSMTEEDRVVLEDLANKEGVTMAGLIHSWIKEHTV